VDLFFCCAKAEVALATTSTAINKENRSIQNSPLFKARTLNAGFDPFNLFARKPPLARVLVLSHRDLRQRYFLIFQKLAAELS
jgi:hypothetical protein